MIRNIPIHVLFKLWQKNEFPMFVLSTRNTEQSKAMVEFFEKFNCIEFSEVLISKFNRLTQTNYCEWTTPSEYVFDNRMEYFHCAFRINKYITLEQLTNNTK